MNPLPPNLISILGTASAELETVVELQLDSGTITISHTKEHGIPVLKSTSTLLHKLQATHGKTSVGKITIQLIDRSEWGPIVANNYIKNRRANIKIGPRGGGSADFYTWFTGLITDFDTQDETLSLHIHDDLYVAKKEIPEENEAETQSLKFQNQNPIDIKKTLIETYGEVPSARIDADAFTYEKTNNFPGWFFDRVLTEPQSIKELLNELDEQTLNFVFADGDKITTATFGPLAPGKEALHISDDWLRGGPQLAGAMDDNFFNVCVVYYDYDESGGDEEQNFDGIAIVSDSLSQSSSRWNEVKKKVIKSKWIRSLTIAQPTNITGVVIYHCNPQNGAGTGNLAYNATNKTLTWTAPGDSAGTAVEVKENGKFQVFSGDVKKYIRVVVTYDSLPGSNQSDNLTITTLPGANLAGLLASHWVARYADPQAELSFDLDLSAAIYHDEFIRLSDIVRITSDRIITKGKPGWNQECVFLTSARPDFSKKQIKISSIQTSFGKRYGFIGPSTMTSDYDAATETERQYGFIGDSNNEVGSESEDGYYIW